MNPPLRLLTAVPICDGHDSAITTINLEFIRRGIEVIYLGYHRSARDIVRAAIQEDVRAIGLSSYNGGHVEFFSEVRKGLDAAGARDIGLFGGGGGTITTADARAMKRRGVDEVFFAGTPLDDMTAWVQKTYGAKSKRVILPKRSAPPISDLPLARLLTQVECHKAGRATPCAPSASSSTRRGAHGVTRPTSVPKVFGITGPGGAGKTTLLDELVLRFLRSRQTSRVAILSHDPSVVGRGALLGDRATMIHSQDDRVFMRSLATRGQAGGLSSATARCLKLLRSAGFDLVLVETVGIGQEAAPFMREHVDKTVLVMNPTYGAQLQLQKIVMLDVADVVVVNKADLAGAPTARAEIERRLELNGRGQKLFTTVAKRHGDPGVDELFRELLP